MVDERDRWRKIAVKLGVAANASVLCGFREVAAALSVSFALDVAAVALHVMWCLALYSGSP